MKEKLIYYPLFNWREKSKELKEQIQSQLYKELIFTDDINKANAILVGWWDGFMLDTIKEYMHLNKIFVGVNCGTLWFLLNNIENIWELPSNMEDLDIYEEWAIKATVETKENEKIVKYGFNDIVIGGNVLDFFKITIDGESIKEEIQGTWLLITTPIWSTAYWLKMWGPMLPLNGNLWGVMWIGTRPFNYKVIEPEKIRIEIEWRSPTIAGIDGYGGKIENIKALELETCTQSIKIGFLKDQQFDTKRVMMASKVIG